VIDSTGNIADSLLTTSTGHYETDLGGGIYTVYFTEPGYAGHGIYNLEVTAPTTLANVMLSELPAGTTLTDTISGELPAGTYLIEGNITIQSGDSLTIAPGSRFLFSFQYSFEIYGKLTAVGTTSDSIYFMSASETVPWVSIIFRNGSSPESELSYCYITDAGGSAINTYWTDIAISHCTITENTANWGGGIYISYCAPRITECVVSNNSAKHNGGGIYATRSDPTILNCIVTGNECNWGEWGSGRGGGGITANHQSNPIITGCYISGNRSYYHGGGISINDDSHPVITDCIITNNVADTTGGGICCHNVCHPVMTNCVIDSNTAMKGGGICFGLNSDFVVDSCQVNNNTADTLGGGLYVFNSRPSFSYCTVAYNTAPDSGGGIYALHTNMNISNCTFSHNNSAMGGNAFFTADSLDTLFADTLINNIFAFAVDGEGVYIDSFQEGLSMSYCDIYGNAGGHFGGVIPESLGDIVTTNANDDSCDVFYNIFFDPLFVDPVALNYHLLSGSHCIDAGDPNFPLDPDTTVVDIGAFYFDQHSAVPIKPLSLQPKSYQLHPPYPNPFNPVTTISYEIPATGHVKLVIYNLLGRQVATLVDRTEQSGTHTITWNAGNYPSGIYFCRLEAPDYQQTRKLLLLK
jgi:predicted outer membrane repeat protein